MKRTTLNVRPPTPGYTLIELLIAMGIIVFLAGLLILLWPGLNSSLQTTRNADKIQSFLLNSRSIAQRDRLPTGVRLVLLDPTTPLGTTAAQLVYVQQPAPYTPPINIGSGGTTIGTLLQTTGSTTGLSFANVDFTGGMATPTDYLVQAGDYLEINGGGPLHQISDVNSLTTISIRDPISLATPTTNWKIIRQPRPLAGEEPLNLSGTMVIDLSLSQNVPLRALTTGKPPQPVYFCEIMFSPSGSVTGQGTLSSDKILLWVRDGSLTDPTQGEPVLVGIQVGTGFIGGYPVDISQSGGDYFSNTRDPHASGM